MIVWQPSAAKGLSALVASAPLATWKEYLVFHAVDRSAPLLPKAFVEEHFAFYGQTSERARRSCSARWKRAVAATNAALGDAVGKLYVERYFPPEAKAAGAGHGEKHHRRLQPADRPADVDGSADQGQGQGEALHPLRRRRLPRALAGLRAAGGRAGRRAWPTPSAAELFEYRRRLAKLGGNGRPRRVVDDAADGERGEPAAAERAQFPGGDPAAAVTSTRARRRP